NYFVSIQSSTGDMSANTEINETSSILIEKLRNRNSFKTHCNLMGAKKKLLRFHSVINRRYVSEYGDKRDLIHFNRKITKSKFIQNTLQSYGSEEKII